MEPTLQQAELYLNGVCVGVVTQQGSSSSWGYGQFKSAPAFSRFATLFGSWSLLIHEDDGQSRPSREALEELREVEARIDTLRAELRWPAPRGSLKLAQLNIDGTLIEWKHR